MLSPWGIRMTGLDDPLRFWEVLRSTVPDLLILDIDMPQVSGIELCQAVRADPQWQGLPILFLTAIERSLLHPANIYHWCRRLPQQASCTSGITNSNHQSSRTFSLTAKPLDQRRFNQTGKSSSIEP
jgi:CheY-like chemotaxis protein